ncbi:hypothetical protein [Streptomyces sp. OE57]|uniref:hypothetical protein n=1 Tax=Streptomyces lacaronensis TaxID=3379885 RepID=UPI0039B74FFD
MNAPNPSAELNPAAPDTRTSRSVAVVVVADDPITAEGVVTYLRSTPATTVVPRERAGEADVALFVAVGSPAGPSPPWNGRGGSLLRRR